MIERDRAPGPGQAGPSLDPAQSCGLQFRGERLVKLLSYWMDLSPPDGIPDKADFDPMRVHDLLYHLSLIEMGPQRPQYRLISEAARLSLPPGKKAPAPYEHAQPHLRESFESNYRFMLANPCIVYARHQFAFVCGSKIDIDVLLVPFLSRGEIILALAAEELRHPKLIEEAAPGGLLPPDLVQYRGIPRPSCLSEVPQAMLISAAACGTQIEATVLQRPKR